MTKICEVCGKNFEAKSSNARYCPVCRNRNRTYCVIEDKVKQSVGLPVKTLNEWSNEAAECNLDYGTYRVLIEQGKTFDELKRDRDHRPVHMHAHGHHTRSIRDE